MQMLGSERLPAGLEGYRAAVEERLREVTAGWATGTPGSAAAGTGAPVVEVSAVDTLASAMTYALDGGKRLRGAIALAFCDSLGGSLKRALPFAAALEMVHAYSLVHDDLPCMDNDDFRRGKPSCHKQFGYATALLTGDALLTGAFEVAASAAGQGADVPPSAVARCVALLAHAAGPLGMVGGQAIDLALEGKKAGPAAVSEMYRFKTGAMFEASAAIGAVLAGAAEDAVRAAAGWGAGFGYAFQVIDDLDDLAQSEKEQEKDTLAGETSLAAARLNAARALRESLAYLNALGGGPPLARELSEAYLEKCGESNS